MPAGAAMYAKYSEMNPRWNPQSEETVYHADTTETYVPNPVTGQAMGDGPVDPTPVEKRGFFGKPATWWLMLIVVFAGLMFVSRRFGGDQKFGNVRFTVWNGILMTIFYVIILNFLKVLFSQVRVPGLSELIAAA